MDHATKKVSELVCVDQAIWAKDRENIESRFPASNNEVEYEAIIFAWKATLSLGTWEV